MILANSKLDADNPTLREWCMLFTRNITAWSDPVRTKLQSLTMRSDDPADAESRAAFDTLGKPMQEMYKKEAEKYKRDDED